MKKFSRKVLAGILSASLVASQMGVLGANAASVQGDINNDGVLSAADVFALNNYLTGITEADESFINAADMNGDKLVNIIDYILLVNKLVEPEEIQDPPVVTEDKTITLNGDSIAVTGTGTTVNGSVVTITEPGTYVVTGKLNDGQIIVNIDKTVYPEEKVELSLEGTEITSLSNSPIYVASVDDECVITVKKGTENIISDGKEYTNADEASGAIYSKDDLKIKGKGSLIVNGNCSDGIVSKDSVKIFNGNITVNSVDDGIRGKDSVKIGDSDDTDFSNLKVTVNSESGDGIKATNSTDEGKGKVIINGGTVKIKTFGDGIQGESDVKIAGGDIDIYTYQGSGYVTGQQVGDGNANKMPTDLSAKAIKSSKTINILGGNIVIDSSDDAIHGAEDVNVTGGSLKISTADDAVHSDTNLTIGAGTADTYDDVFIYVPKCYEGIEAQNVTQNSGTCLVYADDDGYNAAGGADGSGMTGPGGWNQGGWGGFNPGGGNTPGGGTSSGNYALNLNGGLAFVSSADGDHDGFDSNGAININGAIAISNGNEPFDSDGNKTFTAGTFIELKGNSGGFGGGFGGFGGSSLTASFTATISAQAGNRITVCDDSGNVIVSFLAGKSATSCSVGSKTVNSGKVVVGGTVNGGTKLPVIGDSQEIYVGGTLN